MRRRTAARVAALALNCAPGQLRGADGRCGHGIGLGIGRDDMPQILSDDLDEFLGWVRAKGIRVQERTLPAVDFQPVQSEFRQDRVDAISEEAAKKPIISSSEGGILDGTHRWVKQRQRGADTMVNTLQIDLGTEEALDLMRQFPKAKFVANVARNAFNPDQERGENGKWISSGAGSSHLSASSASNSFIGNLAEEDNPTSAEKEVGNAVTSDHLKTVTLEKDGKVLGAVAWSEPRKGVRAIEHMGSLEKGVGKKLMEKAKSGAQRVIARNVVDDAKGFYEKMGFKKFVGDDMVWDRKIGTTNAERKRAKSVLALDPSRTLSLRKGFARKIKKKFAILKGRLVKLIILDDAFGLKRTGVVTANAPGEFGFKSTPEQLKLFQDWLRTQTSLLLIGKSDEELWRAYAEAGFKKGAGRAFDDLKAAPSSPPGMDAGDAGDWLAGGRDQFLRSAFGRPESVNKIKLLASRSLDDLKNVTHDMTTRMSRTLVDGLTQGKNPRDIADDMVDDLDIATTRADIIARTEIIRAHAEGQLHAFEEMGIEEVGVAVEFSTAGDERVCPECAILEGVVLKVEEAHNTIPVHPQCRCAFIPANVGEDDANQKDTKKGIDKAFDDAGFIDKTVSKDRPVSTTNIDPLLLSFSMSMNVETQPT